MKKMNIKSKLVRVAAIASAFFIGATPLTAFAQANPETEAVEVEVLEKDVITDTEETEVEAEIPYHYTVNEDGSIVFSFNGEEYTYGAEADPTGKVVTGGSRLNVRTGAGMDYEIIDQLCPGEEVSVIGTEGDWYQIIVPAKTGYVHSDYLQVLESASNETDAALLQMFMMMFMDSMNNAGDVNYALTPDGNMNLIDDYGSATKAGKQFITLTTKTSYGKSSEIIQCNTKDAAADELAKRIGGQSRSAFADDPIQREFDVISDQYIAQAKPPLKCVNKTVRTQMKATFEAAKKYGRKVYYQFEGIPSQEVLDKLYEYSERYGVEVIIDTEPLGVLN